VLTGFAVWCGLTLALPAALTQILMGLVWLAASVFLLTGLVFARGDAQAFCLGAVLVVTSTWTGLGGRLMDGVHRLLQFVSSTSVGDALWLWVDLVVLTSAAVGMGWLAVVSRRFFLGRRAS
jgi:hypothetical protein